MSINSEIRAANDDDDVLDDAWHHNSDVLKAEANHLRNSNHVGREGWERASSIRRVSADIVRS